MSQLAFSWPAAPTYASADFIVAEANAAAASFIDSWPRAMEPAALLTGPAASGKTHLAHRFAERTGATFLGQAELGLVPSDQLWGKARFAILEDIETLRDETAFFHLLRHAETTQTHLLLTSRVPTQELPFQLADIRSRLLALPVAAIAQPDEDLLNAFFTKSFADRQWRIAANVTQYITLRTERSFAAAQELMHKLEKLLSTTNREITIPLIKPLVE